MTLEPWAKAQVERLIAPLGDRWAHVQAVARQARRVAEVLSAEDGDVLIAAAFLQWTAEIDRRLSRYTDKNRWPKKLSVGG